METIIRYVDDLRSLLDESSLAERKSFIRSFVKDVRVAGNEVLLTYTMPLPPAGISQEMVGVLGSSPLRWTKDDFSTLGYAIIGHVVFPV